MKVTLRSARVNAGMTLSEASLVIGCHSNTLRNWELGKTPVPSTAIPRIAHAYGMKPTDIRFF